MARKKSGHRSRLHLIVTVLVTLVVAFCALSSWEDKGGADLGLPTLKLPFLGFVEDFFDGLDNSSSDMDNALPVVKPLGDAQLEVHILDMGQADSILIKGPGANVLIDAGENNQGEQVVRYLKAQGVSKIDYLIGTHPHSDHIGGMDTVIKEMKIGAVILPTLPDEVVPTTQTYTDLLVAIGNKGLGITPAKVGKTLDLGEGAELKLLGPIAEYTDLNNMSVVSRLTYGDTSFLFTGDASEGSEGDILASGKG